MLKPADYLNRYIARLDQKINALQSLHRRLSRWRLLLFTVGIVIAFIAFRSGEAAVGWGSIAVFGIGFLYVARLHRRIESSHRRHRIWQRIKQQHLASLSLDWENLPLPSAFEVSPEHPFASDLNLVGHRSLHHLLDTTVTLGGSRRLLDWLLSETPSAENAMEQQKWVQILRSRNLFRDKLALLSRATHRKAGTKHDDGLRWDDAALQKWLQEKETPFPFRPWLIGLGIFALFNIIMLLFVPKFAPLGIVLYWLVYGSQFPKLKGAFEESQDTQAVLQRFMPPMLFLEKYRSSKLKDLLAPLQHPQYRPSVFTQRLTRIANFSALSRNEFLFVLLNTLMPWDMLFSFLLDRAKAGLQQHLPEWLRAWYKTEALCALATYADLHPRSVFPTFSADSSSVGLKAEQMGHPLIRESQKISNDFEMDTLGEIALFTGSNMSGKSTFLRTVGVNVVLAQAGGTVDAASFQLTPMRVFSCMNVSDSVNDGLSYFYAEVKRLKALLNAAQVRQESPLFFLIDEIFRGTNNRERLAGSRAFIHALAHENGLGMISTHDLELVTLEEALPNLHNFHFREDVTEGKMTFDYLLRKGACPTTNALKIMEIEGLPIK
jgi:hypothetical protein